MIKTLLLQMSNVKKPQLKFLLVLFEMMMCLRGRATYRNMSRYSNLNEKTYARWSRHPFDFAEFNCLSLQPLLSKQHEWVAAVDCSFSEKSGRKTFGLGMFYNGKQSKTEKGLEIATLALVDVEYNTAYSLSTRQTPASVEQGATRVDQYLEFIRQDRASLPDCVRYLVADGFYSKTKFIEGIANMGLQFISKLRSDANLRWLFTGEQKPRGRKRRYDGKVDFTQRERFEFVEECDGITLYTAVVNSPCFKRDIRVVYLVKTVGKREQTALLFSTDVELAAQDIYRYYKARFQIEFLFRDAKQFLGLSHCQSCREDAQHFHFNASMTALNLLKLEDRLSSPDSDKRQVISIANWTLRKANEHLLKRFSSCFGLDFSAIQSRPDFADLCHYGTVAH